MTAKVKTIFQLVGQDSTKAAFNSLQRNVKTARRSILSLRNAFLGLGAASTLRGIVNAGIQMEKFERSLRVATGSAEGARREMDFVVQTSKSLGLSLEETADSYTKLTAAARGTSLQGQAAREIFLGVSAASTVLGLSAEQTGGALTAIEQIISKGKVSAEELRRQLGDRLPGAFQIAARSIGVTTQELDRMLKAGELTADELLPALAKELRATFGPEVADAANSAQAAINRFATSIFELKNSIAESGILDTVSTLADRLARIISPSLGQELEDVAQEIIDLQNEIAEGPGAISGPHWLSNRQIQLEELQQRYDELLVKQGELLGGAGDVGSSTGISETSSTIDAHTQALEQFKRQYETAEQRVARLRAELAQFKIDLDPAEFERINQQIGSILTDGLEEITIDVKRRVTEPLKGAAEESSEIGSLFRNAFESSFFGPFENSTQNMVRSFTGALQRMLIKAIATDLFGALFGGGKASSGTSGFFSSLFGISKPNQVPGFAFGGSFKVGGTGGTDSQFVPFFATPGETVTVSRAGQSEKPNLSIVQNIDFGGNRVDELELLMPIAMKQATEAAVHQMFDLKARGHF